MEEQNKTKRPPNDRGQGRKPLPVGMRRKNVSIPMNDEERLHYQVMGGADFVRSVLSFLFANRR